MKITKYNITLIMIIILIIVSVLMVLFPKKTYTSEAFEIVNRDTVKEFYNDDLIEQEFISKNNYKSVGIQIATYATLVKNGQLIVIIENERGQQKKYTINTDSIIDNQFYYLKYNLRKNKHYKLIIDGEKLSTPVTFLTTQKQIEGAKLTINGKEKKSSLILAFIKTKKNYFSIWYCLLAISILTTYLFLVKETD